MPLVNNKAITLPSFLRRVMKAYLLKTEIRRVGATLQRIGRSRNWQLKASFAQIEDIIKFIEKSDEQSWQWLAKHLAKQHQDISYDMLKSIALDNEGISIQQLVTRTNCTLLQARKVIDEIEWDD